MVLSAVCLLSGCGRQVGHMMTSTGWGPDDPQAQDFVRNSRKGTMSYISLDPPYKSRKMTMTPQRAEYLKRELEESGQMAENKGILAVREGGALDHKQQPQQEVEK